MEEMVERPIRPDVTTPLINNKIYRYIKTITKETKHKTMLQTKSHSYDEVIFLLSWDRKCLIDFEFLI